MYWWRNGRVNVYRSYKVRSKKKWTMAPEFVALVEDLEPQKSANSQLATNRIGLPGKLIKWFTFLI